MFAITGRGREVLARKPPRIDRDFLRQFPEFREFLTRTRGERPSEALESDDAAGPGTTPEERIDAAARELKTTLVEELLDRLRRLSPTAFEPLVVELLLAMGYGARGRGVRIGRSGDGGIDGFVDEDTLGLDTVYLQAKRYGEGSSVGREQLQAFAGALMGHGAHKGVFVTTGRFTEAARAWAKDQRERRIVLVDGEQLAELVLDHGVGVRTLRTVEIRSLDEDWFEQLPE